jgi:benzylsuccinate CoA-transferase BbsE subunit
MSETTNEHSGSLNGLRVLDLTEERGLYTGKVLADLGADVVLVERPERSRARSLGPFKHNSPGVETSLYSLNFNTNKRGITLNLDTVRGRDVFIRLAKASDVVVDDYPLGRMHSYRQLLGLPAAEVEELIRDQVIY